MCVYIYIKLGFAASQKKKSSLWIPHGGFTIGAIKNHQQIQDSEYKVCKTPFEPESPHPAFGSTFVRQQGYRFQNGCMFKLGVPLTTGFYHKNELNFKLG